jgi:OPA family glycerol-3-phosphate transporter-like MFS transporter
MTSEHKIKEINFWHIWSSYATYYFGRVNLSIIIPILLATYGLSKYNLGLVTSGFFFAYAIGQFLHGQISEKYNPITYISIGLIGSAIMNLFLGFAGGFFWILFIGEIMNGGFQSMGWSSAVRANAEISKKNKKDINKTSCLLGTSYQVGNSVTWLISALVVGLFGWQWGFWIASAFMFMRGLTLLLAKPKSEVKKVKIKNQIKNTLTLPIIVCGICMALLNIVRYGIIIWIPTYLVQVQGASIIETGLKIFLIPIAGVFGTLIYNKVKTNRSILTAIFLGCLWLLFIVFGYTSGFASVMILLLSGFFLYGPHVFLVSTFPSMFVDKKIVASSTGFIDGMAYVGAILVGIIVPFFIDFRGWNFVFLFWSTLCLVIILLILFLYLFMKKDGKLAKNMDVIDYEETKKLKKLN